MVLALIALGWLVLVFLALALRRAARRREAERGVMQVEEVTLPTGKGARWTP